MRALRLFIQPSNSRLVKQLIEEYNFTQRLRHVCDFPPESQLSTNLFSQRYNVVTTAGVFHKTHEILMVYRRGRVVDTQLLADYLYVETGELSKTTRALTKRYFDDPNIAGDIPPFGTKPYKTLIDGELVVNPDEEVYCYIGDPIHYLAITPIELFKLSRAAEIAFFCASRALSVGG